MINYFFFLHGINKWGNLKLGQKSTDESKFKLFSKYNFYYYYTRPKSGRSVVDVYTIIIVNINTLTISWYQVPVSVTRSPVQTGHGSNSSLGKLSNLLQDLLDLGESEDLLAVASESENNDPDMPAGDDQVEQQQQPDSAVNVVPNPGGQAGGEHVGNAPPAAAAAAEGRVLREQGQVGGGARVLRF